MLEQRTLGLTLTLLAGFLVTACMDPNSLCKGLMEHDEDCDEADYDSSEELDFVDHCVDWFEEAEREEPDCYDAGKDLAACINRLSCSQWDDYWNGDPWEDTDYPCYEADVAIYVESDCSVDMFP